MTKDKSIFIKNIYYMLSYAFQTLNQENYDDVAAESFDEMYDLLAAILAKGIGIQLKQGLYREYINRQEELPVMRGKINLPGTIKNRLVRKQLLTCDYDEFFKNDMVIALSEIMKDEFSNLEFDATDIFNESAMNIASIYLCGDE